MYNVKCIQTDDITMRSWCACVYEEEEAAEVVVFLVFFFSPSSLCFSIFLMYSAISSDSRNYSSNERH